MTLTPIKSESIFKSADPEFNHDAAQAAYDLVMKMDADEARAFTQVVVSDVVEEIIEKNLRTVQAHLNKVVAKRISLVKKALVTQAVSKSAEALPYAQALALFETVAKANPYDYGYVFRESDFNRDPGTGRFRTKVTHSQTKPIHDKTAASLGIKPHPKKMSAANKAQYQDEYRQLASFLGAVHSSSVNPGDSEVVLRFRDKRTGAEYAERLTGTRAQPQHLDPTDRMLVGIEAKPNTLTVGGAAFGLSHSLSRRGVEGINAVNDSMGSFADSWTAETDSRSSNERTFRRIKAGSDFVGAVAPAGSQAQLAAAFGSFVGSMGPEAEKVIGPTARKTAYRYRGTEKTPDKTLVGAYNRALNAAKMQSAADPFRNTPEGRQANLKRPQDLAPSQMAAARVSAERRSATWEERDNGRAVVRAYLEGKLPDRRLYALQLASGNTPPSQGVMLDKNGQIVAEAVGYGDDHYLPFNLKNLKGLKGGEYIRTRSVGGLTSEDIYTGLITGARQVTVVSRSGTFTLEFAEDFKGGRRHNDKARRMTRRYQQILDAVQSEQIDKGPVRPEIREIIENQVRAEMEGGASPREINRVIRERVEEYKSDPELSAEDEILINAMSRAAMRDGVTRDEKEYRRQVTGLVLAQKATRYKLNGDGYSAALKALEEQFPYYVTAKPFPKDEQDVENLELDAGYVEPGRNRPTAAAAGLFGAAHSTKFAGQGTKFSAAEANQPRTSAPKATPPEKTATATGEAAKTPTPQRSITAEQMASYLPAVAEMQQTLVGFGESSYSPDQLRTLRLSPDEIAADPVKQKEFDDLVSHVERTLTAANRQNELGLTLTRYRRASGAFSRLEWNPARAGFAANMPFAFEGKAYESDDPGAKAAELRKIEAKMPTSIASTKRLSEMSDGEFIHEVSRLTQIKAHLSAAGLEGQSSADAAVARAQAIKQVAPDPDSPSLKRLLANPGLVDDYLEQVHRARAVLHGVPDDQRSQIKVVHAPAQSETQRTGYRNGALSIAERLEQLAETLEQDDNHDIDLTTDLRASASGIRERTRTALSEGDARSILDAHRDLIVRASNEVQRRNRGNGSILS